MIEGGPGQFVGDRYHIVREIGRGGMGVVYLGRDLRLDMDVAIKFRGVTHSDATLWLKREFRTIASLRHPNLVELYELVAHERSCYFTMEYLHGVDPRRWVERRSQPRSPATDPQYSDLSTRSALPVQDAHTEATASPPPAPVYGGIFARPVPAVDFHRVRSVIAQLAQGLAFLHARGVIHRDVKPSNAIVVDGAVKLLDFGLALERHRLDEDLARETRIVGTAAYLAPEYIERLVVTSQMDIYALGVLGFELCTGAPPFGGTLHVLTRLDKTIVVPHAAELNPDVPRDLDALIDRMLAADPARRPSALEIVEEITGAQSQPHPVRREPRFVGREHELGLIAAAVADPTPHARVVLVTGPSGVGKTALIDEAASRARASHPLAWRARCHERERVPYRAFDLIIDDLATRLAGDPRLAREIEHAPALCRVFPVLAPLVDPALADEPPAADLRVERERALHALLQMFRTMMSGASGVLVIDDLQWADDDSLELLALLVEKIGHPLTVIGSWTTEGELPTVLRELLVRLGAAATVIDVPAMGDDDLARVIADLAPDAPAARLVAAARLAAGSPYLAEVIASELADLEVVDADPHRAERRRLDRLPAQERAVAEIAALAGGTASFEQLRALSELGSSRLQSVLRGLADARIVRATPAISGDPVYVFYHQRLRETAHAAMTEPARRALHERFATWFERTSSDPGQLAYHWQHAGQEGRAAQWAIVAGEAAQAQLAWGIAADWYARALTLGNTERSVQERLAECLFLGGKLAAAAIEFLSLARLADGIPTAPAAHGRGGWRGSIAPLTRTRVLAAARRMLPAKPMPARDGDRWRVRAGEAYLKLGELDRGLEILDGVLEARGKRRTSRRVVSVARAVGVAARWMSPLGAGHAPVDEVLVSSYRVIASFLSTPYPIESFEYVLRGVQLAERSGDHAAHAMGLAMLSAYLATGSLGQLGDRAIARARQLSADVNAPYPRIVTAGATGILATLRGDWRGMRVAHEEGEVLCKRVGLERSWEASFLRTYWALGEYYAGEPARALELLGGLSDTSEDLWTRAMLRWCRGRALLVTGDLDQARAIACGIDRTPVASQGMSGIYRHVFLGELALAEHAWDRALVVARDATSYARAGWLHTIPAVAAMLEVLTATAEVGLAVAGDRAAADRARTVARRLYRRGKSSFYAPTGLRLWAQAERALGNEAASAEILARAAASAATRGGQVDRLAIAALGGHALAPGALGFAISWTTGGQIGG